MSLFFLEYAQKRNGEFAAWIDGGEFPTYAAALAMMPQGAVAGEDFNISIFQPTEAQSKYPGMHWNIIWPEYRALTEQQIRLWYSDALANGEDVADGLTDTDEMARELNSLGAFTLGR